MSHSKPDIRNPDAPRSNYGLLVLRWGGLTLLAMAAISGREEWAWAALPVLAFVLIMSWGLHVTFTENLKALHYLTPKSTDGDYGEDMPGVTIVSPARNEALCIEEAVRGLEALDYPEFEIIVVDDHSSDGTSEILERLAEEMPRIRVLKDPPLREGWLGKTTAAMFGARHADPNHEWLLFRDADVKFHPKLVRRSVSYAEANRLDFLTCIPFITNASLAEELVLPVPQANVILHAHPDNLNQPSTRAIGGGAFMLVRRDVYWAIGGHAACCDAPDEAIMAEEVKRHKGKVGAAWTSDMVMVRSYNGYRDMRARFPQRQRMVSGDRLSYQIGEVGQALLLFVAPLPLALAAVFHQVGDRDFSFAFTSYAVLAILVYMSGAMAFRSYRVLCRIRAGVPWLHPLGGVLRIWFGIQAIAGTLRKTKITWRGRAIPEVRR